MQLFHPSYLNLTILFCFYFKSNFVLIISALVMFTSLLTNVEKCYFPDIVIFFYENNLDKMDDRYLNRENLKCPSDRERLLEVPCAESHPLSRFKKNYGNLDMVTCWLSSASRSVQSTPADNARQSVRQYIKKEKSWKTADLV